MEPQHKWTTMQEIETTLRRIAQDLEENGSVEITDDDELRDALGLPAEGDWPRTADCDATFLAETDLDTIPVSHRLYRLETGDYIHIKKATKNQGEYYTRYYVKGLGEMNVEPKGIDRDELESLCDDLAIPVNDEVYTVADEFMRESAGVLIQESDYYSVAVEFDGSRFYVEVEDRYAGWDTVKNDILAAADQDAFPDPEEVRNSRIETEEDVRQEEWSLFVQNVFQAANTERRPGGIDTDVTADYEASVAFEHSHLLD